MSSPATLPAARQAVPALDSVQAEPCQDAAGTLPDSAARLDVLNWDVMFDAVRARLLQTVGERLGELPDVPQHSAELSMSLVQAVVLDCVIALDQLHAALQQERSQRPTA